MSLHKETRERVPTYRVWGMDNTPYGAVELAALAQWINDERLTADHWVFSEPENRWQKAADFPELRALFGSKPHSAYAGTAGKTGNCLGVKPEALRRMKSFAGMDEGQIESFVRYMEVLRCEQFSHIVRKGEHGDAMYLVLEGEVRALAMVDGKESTLATITAGEAFGEISLIDQGPRSSDVVANKESVLLKISSVSFDRLLREAPALAVPFLLGLSRSVVGRVRSLTKRYEDSIRFIRAAKSVK
jgi:hypothetical protein